eukprot:364808-Chlamydomonas_euryale.AAC.9
MRVRRGAEIVKPWDLRRGRPLPLEWRGFLPVGVSPSSPRNAPCPQNLGAKDAVRDPPRLLS